MRLALLEESDVLQLPSPNPAYVTADLRNAVRGILSAQAGRPIGYGFEKLIQVFHHLYDRAPPSLLPFGCAVKNLDRQSQLKTEDKKGRWAARSAAVREDMREGSSKYLLDDSDHEFICFLFPELSDAITRARRSVSEALRRRIAAAENDLAF